LLAGNPQSTGGQVMFFKRSLRFPFLVMLFGCVSIITLTASTTAQQTINPLTEVKRITVKELKVLLDKNQPLTIIDVRMEYSYEESTTKIKGAMRIEPDEFEAHLKEIPGDKEIVTYCT
jgi:predicted sulfurtransferase